MKKLKEWLKAHKNLWRRILLLGLCASISGLGYSIWRADAYAPTLEGNVYSMLALEDSIFMVLSNESNNGLVHVDYEGNLLNYATTRTNQAYEYLEASGDTVYAIQSTYEHGEEFQTLVSFSVKDASMRPRKLTDLPRNGNASAVPISWNELYLPTTEEDGTKIRLAGISADGQGYLMTFDAATGRVHTEEVLTGEKLYALKFVQEEHYVYICRDGKAGQEIGGVRQTDVLKSKAAYPHHISTCGTRCFLADSISGDIFELLPDGSAKLFRQGGAEIGTSGFQYKQLEIFTTLQGKNGEIHPIGLCAASEDGNGSVVAGETHSLRDLELGSLRFLMLWEHGWRAALAVWFTLIVLSELIRLMFYSRRLVVRLSACEIIAALVLIGAMTLAQFSSFQQTIQEDARQKLRMIGSNLAVTLAADRNADGNKLAETVIQARHQATTAMGGQDQQYKISVVWTGKLGPVIGYDAEAPAGCLVEDMQNRNYLRAVKRGIETGRGDIYKVRNDNNTDYMYVEPFLQNGRIGCVAVSQAEEVILTGRTTFLQSLVPVLIAGPLLFIALILMTRRLLQPLGVIRESLEEFYDCGGGNQMELDRMPKTELYEVGRVFNQLSTQTKVQMNTLSTINGAYVRLVPNCLLHMLGKSNVLELQPGEFSAVDGAMLMMVPDKPARTAALLETLMEPAASEIQAHQGMIVDYDEGLGALTAIFASPEQAQDCARLTLESYAASGHRVMAAVFTEKVEVGVFGAETLMYPLAVSGALYRRQEALALLSSFDAALVQSGDVTGAASLRLLGWDNGLAYYEDPACRPSDWQAQWHEASALWEQAMSAFKDRSFAEAMRKFARVLRVLPGDAAARWYLFRCEALRDGKIEDPDTGLLFDWRDRHG